MPMSEPSEPHAFVRMLPSQLEPIPQLCESLGEWLESQGAPMKVANAFGLMLDELITNVVTHGYGEQGDGQIRVEARVQGTSAEVLLVDQARPFDPLQAPMPDTTLALEDREIGGLGVFFVRKMADEVHYRRTAEAGGSNELRLVKRW